MKTLNGLPVYKMVIDEFDNITGVEFISLVDYPAIEVNWVAMSSKGVKLFAAETDKQILTGPAMIPDLPIYRSDVSDGEYYVSFDPSEIEKISRKFNREQRTLGINYQHLNDSQVQSAVIVEQWFITDKANDKSNALGFDLPVGTWMVSVHISDEKFWKEEIKTGNVRGFSIEGFLNMEMKKVNMSKKKFEAFPRAEGGNIFIDGALAVDSYAYCEQSQTILIDGKSASVQYPAWDTIVELADGQILTLENGKIVEIKQKEATTMSKIKLEVQAKTKDGAVLWTPAEAFAEGVEVYVVADNGDQSPAADGDYVMEDGSTVTVKEGKVTAIVAVETEETPVENAEVKHAVTPEDIAAIGEALGIADLIKRIEALEAANTALSTENTAMKSQIEKFAALPGAGTATGKTDDKVFGGKMSFADKVEKLQSIKRK